MAKRLALIDGDMVAYRLAASMQSGSTFDFGDGPVAASKPRDYLTAQEEYSVDRQIAMLTKEAKCDAAFVALTSLDRDSSFRCKLDDGYKKGRGERPPLLPAVKEYLKEEWDAVERDGLEADDILGIKATEPGACHVLVSNDKDFLQVPGRLFNPYHKNGPYFTAIDQNLGDFAWMKQVLIGDTCDNYKGCPGIGPAKANALLVPHFGNLEAMWNEVVNAFEKRWLTADDALLQARLARVLRYGEWSPKKGVILWTPPLNHLVSQPTAIPQSSPLSKTPASANSSTPALAATPAPAKAASISSAPSS